MEYTPTGSLGPDTRIPTADTAEPAGGDHRRAAGA